MSTKIIVHKKCNKCIGEMKSTGMGITTIETYWEHKCKKCGHQEQYDRTYPYSYVKHDTVAHEWED